MDVNVTQKELEAIQKVENMQISFLEYDLEKKCFSTEVPVGDISNGDVGVGPQGHRQLYEFWGPNKHQSLLWGRIQLEGKWRDVKLTIDSGSECTAISSATLDELWQRWRGKLKKNPGCTLSGPAGEELVNLGKLALKMDVCGQIIQVEANVLQSPEKSILLGSPQIQELKLGLIPGTGVYFVSIYLGFTV